MGTTTTISFITQKRGFKEQRLYEIFSYFRMKSFENEKRKLELQRLLTGRKDEEL